MAKISPGVFLHILTYLVLHLFNTFSHKFSLFLLGREPMNITIVTVNVFIFM